MRVDGGPDALFALLDWFDHDDDLRGRVQPVSARPVEGQMSGGVTEGLRVGLGTSGIGSALLRSLTSYLTYRRSDVRITLTRSDGTRIDIDATRVDSAQVLRELRTLLNAPGAGSTTVNGDGNTIIQAGRDVTTGDHIQTVNATETDRLPQPPPGSA